MGTERSVLFREFRELRGRLFAGSCRRLPWTNLLNSQHG
jgi:hypothetical protein